MNNRFNNYDLAEQKAINVLSQNNPGAKIIVEKMLNDENLAEYITVCDDLDIRGSKLCLLYSDCCKNNDYNFQITLYLFQQGVFTKEDVTENLSLDKPIPFLSDLLPKVEGINDRKFPLETRQGWNEYCTNCREIFTAELNKQKQRLSR
ncbi:MAG: hypothetical protein J5634_00615 [Bacilli bacterium]|nr:hypothetical protein [Bacilli bacterium]